MENFSYPGNFPTADAECPSPLGPRSTSNYIDINAIQSVIISHIDRHWFYPCGLNLPKATEKVSLP
ncbi:hypothetical protein E2C01_043733 [Portunus trituberculatus]|uniref:Uncharacterized protein n=1 Tax=Portunus trituberculatus TaxID=210409 RepID=A0A5B7FYD1_PORTR|nr:hypothetical protein [Portunus trituberculatus]